VFSTAPAASGPPPSTTSPWITSGGVTAPPRSPAAAEAPKSRLGSRPVSVEEYKTLRRELKEDLKAAERADRDDEARAIRRDMDTVEGWYSEDTEKRSVGAFAGGFVMIGVGGAAVIGGLLVVAFAGLGNALGGDNDEEVAGGAIAAFTGLGLVGGGIPLVIWGGGRVMTIDNAAAPPSVAERQPAPGPALGLYLGPGGATFGGSF
jgi:hypothetical protein